MATDKRITEELFANISTSLYSNKTIENKLIMIQGFEFITLFPTESCANYPYHIYQEYFHCCL